MGASTPSPQDHQDQGLPQPHGGAHHGLSSSRASRPAQEVAPPGRLAPDRRHHLRRQIQGRRKANRTRRLKPASPTFDNSSKDAHILASRRGEGTCGWTRNGCVSKVVEIRFGASPSGLSFAAVRPRGQGFRRRLADRGFPIHRLCASGFGRKRGAPRGASALFRDTAARSVF